MVEKSSKNVFEGLVEHSVDKTVYTVYAVRIGQAAEGFQGYLWRV